MEPLIQYAKTEDGVSIAYWVMGEGEPLVYMPTPLQTHVQREWNSPALRKTYERLAQRRKLIRYDCRAAGLSDRNIRDYSLEGLVRDLEAVTDRLGLKRFSLFAPFRSGPVAIRYAIQHPAQVSNLVLWSTAATDRWGSKALRASSTLIEQDWELFTLTYYNFLLGWSGGEEAVGLAAFMRISTSPEAVLGWDAAFENVDVSDLLGEIRARTLVLDALGSPYLRLADATGLAAAIPDAQLAVPEGRPHEEAWLKSIEDFLDSGDEGVLVPDQAIGGLVTILFTDMASSTTLADQQGDAAAQDVRRAHNDIVRSALTASGGSEIKHTGDGIMASFSTASSGLEAAIAIQRGVAEHKNASPDSPLGVYIGLNAGEPIAEDDDLFGTSVDLAARLVDHAQPGQIIASDVVRQLAAGKQFLFADLGETELRGFEDPIKLWELRWQEED